MGGTAVLGVQKAIMAQAGVAAGDTLRVQVSNDDERREVHVPEELSKALRANRIARTSFEGLSYSHRKEYARYVAEAKRPETRAKRVERTIDMLMEKASAEKR